MKIQIAKKGGKRPTLNAQRSTSNTEGKSHYSPVIGRWTLSVEYERRTSRHAGSPWTLKIDLRGYQRRRRVMSIAAMAARIRKLRQERHVEQQLNVERWTLSVGR